MYLQLISTILLRVYVVGSGAWQFQLFLGLFLVQGPGSSSLFSVMGALFSSPI